MIWFILAAAVVVFVIVVNYDEFDVAVTTIMSILFCGVIALFLNFFCTIWFADKHELVVNHPLAPLSDDKYVLVEDDTMTYRIAGDLGTDSRMSPELIKTDTAPRIEIYNVRSSNKLFTVFGADQIVKLYVPENSVAF